MNRDDRPILTRILPTEVRSRTTDTPLLISSASQEKSVGKSLAARRRHFADPLARKQVLNAFRHRGCIKEPDYSSLSFLSYENMKRIECIMKLKAV